MAKFVEYLLHDVQVLRELVIVLWLLVYFLPAQFGGDKLLEDAQEEEAVFEILELVGGAGLDPGHEFLAGVGLEFSNGELGLHLKYNGSRGILPIINWMDSKQLHDLLQASDDVSATLLSLRNKIASGNANNHVKTPSEWLSQGSHTRHVFRTLAETLQANRNLVQLNKEKIEKSRVFLEGLEYYKTTLRNKIKDYHIDAETVDDYLEKPLGEVEWEGNYQEGEQKLIDSLNSIRANNDKLKERTEAKKNLSKSIAEKQKLFHQTLPQQFKALKDMVAETSKLSGVSFNETLEPIQSPKLAFLFDCMKTLKKQCRIEVAYNRDESQLVEIVFLPSALDSYTLAEHNKIKIEEKEIKIRIVDVSSQGFAKLVVGVDRRCDFTTQQIFCRLINGETTKTLFEAPSNQTERNLNSKYVYLDWLEDLVCASVEEASVLLDTIRKRVFSLSLRKFIFQNTKKIPFYFPVPAPKEGENCLNLKKLNIESVEVLSFREYKELVHVPETLRRALNYLDLAQRQAEKRSTISAMGQESEEKVRLDAERHKVIQLLKVHHLSEVLDLNTYSYHKFSVAYYTLRVTFVLLIPADYPAKLPEVKVLSYERVEDRPAKAPAGIELKGKFELKGAFSWEAETLERESNTLEDEMMPGLKGDRKLSLLLQINKVLTTMGRLQLRHHEAQRKHD